MARDLVRRNVVELAEIPMGRPGRQSKSLIPEQVDAVLIRTAPDRLHNYIVVSLLTGGRTEELRALRWDHVHLEASPPHIEVWRSVRADGDTKTKRSRRTLALPARCVEALRKQRAQQLADRLRVGDRWQENGLVFRDLGRYEDERPATCGATFVEPWRSSPASIPRAASFVRVVVVRRGSAVGRDLAAGRPQWNDGH